MALVFDFITVFIAVSGLNSDVGPFGQVFALLLSMLYFLISFFYIGWAVCVRMRLPAYAQTPIMMGLLGLSKKLQLGVDTYCEGKGYTQPKPSNAPAAPVKPASKTGSA